jgi:hypothetical protein
MRSYMPCRVNIKIGKGTVTTVGKGQASITMVTSDGKHTRVGLTDVYFVPQMAACLISTEGQASMTMVTSDGKYTRVGLTDMYFVP